MDVHALVSYILSYIIASTNALLFANVGVVLPHDPYVFIGDTLNLTCEVTNSDFPDNVTLFFTKMYGKEERPLPSEYTTELNSRSIKLEYPVTSRENQGGYTCLMNRTEDYRKVVNTQYVIVEHRPVAVKNLRTVVHDWRFMITTWELGQEYVNPNHVRTQLQWTIIPKDTEVYKCPHPNITSCIWRENDGRDSFKNVAYYMRVVVNLTRGGQSENVTASVSSEWFHVDTKLFVKPAPVQDLTAVDRNSTCISLSWNNSQNSQLRTIRHTVLVIQDSQLQQNISTDETEHTVCDLTPATMYTFNISCISIPPGEHGPRGYKSDWVGVQTNTLASVNLTKGGQSENVTASVSSEWFQVDTKLFVKPDPVQNLTVVDRNSTCISLSWNHSQLKTIRHTVLVIQDSQLQQNISTDETEHTVCDLTPATMYTFNISCISIPPGEHGPRGYKSDWVGVQTNTLGSVTTAAPSVPALVPSKSTSISMDRGDVLKLIDEQIQLRMKQVEMIHVDKERLHTEQVRLGLNLQRLVLEREKVVNEREKILMDRQKLVRDLEKLIENQEKQISKKKREKLGLL